MKKLILTGLALSIVQFLYSQVFITEIADPNNVSGARYIELYNAGSSAIDLTGWQLQRYTNANPTPTASSIITLNTTLDAGAFYLIAANQATFTSTFGIAADLQGGGGGPADSNGDDNIELLDNTGSTVDIFGVPGEDGTGTDHEFEDGRAERKADVSSGNTSWDVNEWNIDNDSGGGDGAQNAPEGFDPGSWIGASGCGSPVSSGSSAVDANSVTISWGTVNSADEYEVQYKISGSSEDWNSQTVSETSILIENLQPSTGYAVRIRTICGGTLSDFGAIENVTTDDITCEQVVITTSTPSENSIDLTWNSVASASNYEVQYKVSGGASWTSMLEAGTSTTITGLSSSTHYVVRVRAICSGVSGTFSTIESVTTDAISCSQVTVTSSTPSDNSINLTWNSVGSADNYEVQYKVSGSTSWASLFQAETSASITALSASTSYVIRVRAICSGLSGTFSSIESVATNAISCEQVTITSSAPSANSIDLAWNAVGSADNYEVQYKISGSASWTSVVEAGTSTTLSGLSASTNYAIRIRAVCSGVSGTFSTIESVTTDALACDQVVITSATTTDNSIDISWNPVGSAGNYQIQYKVSGGSTWTSTIEAGTSTSLSGLSASTNYVIRVRAICSGISGTFSAIESATTDPISCEQVVVTSTTPSDDSIDLTWNVVGSANEYQIQYKVSGTPVWTTESVTTAFTTINGLLSSTTYVIRIRARCSGIPGSFSSTEVVTTTSPMTQAGGEYMKRQEIAPQEILSEAGIIRWQVYPNPVNGPRLTLSFSEQVISPTVKMTSLDGRLFDTQIVEISNGNMQVDTSDLQNGIYFLQVMTKEHTFIEKVLIKR